MAIVPVLDSNDSGAGSRRGDGDDLAEVDDLDVQVDDLILLG